MTFLPIRITKYFSSLFNNFQKPVLLWPQLNVFKKLYNVLIYQTKAYTRDLRDSMVSYYHVYFLESDLISVNT